MNSKRRAELQRKLSLNAVPRPPAGLAERIKADIPRYLEAETVPQRLTRSLTFHLRIAASVIVLAGAVVVAMMVTRGQQEKMAATATRPVIFAPQSRAIAPPPTTTTVAVARTEEVHLDIIQEAPVVVPEQIASAPPPPSALLADGDLGAREADVASGAEGGAAFDAVEEISVTAEAPVLRAQPQPTAAAAPRAAPAAVTPAEVAAPPSPSAAASETFANAARLERPPSTTAARMMAAEAREREAKTESVFGISVSPDVFHEIRTTLESGRRPSASEVNIEALVNYFAGARRPRRMSLEVEASPALIQAEGEHAVLRFTVDTPAGTGVAASDARIEVVIDDDAVLHAERIGDAEPLARESVLPYGTSVTGLYALEMKPGLRSTQLVATVRLRYFANGKPDVITKLLHGHDLTKSWQRSSRRHRLASLGALWAQSLKGAGAGVDVARRAEELATQDPDDVRARELARAASASAAGGR